MALVVNGGARFCAACREASFNVGADLDEADLTMASGLAHAHRPFAIIVTDDVYAFDRQRLNALAIESDAFLIVWGDDIEAKQLEPLLQGALKRRKAGWTAAS